MLMLVLFVATVTYAQITPTELMCNVIAAERLRHSE